jgi:hypothetical protein
VEAKTQRKGGENKNKGREEEKHKLREEMERKGGHKIG